MRKLTQTEKSCYVRDSPALNEEYIKQLHKSELHYSKNNCKIGKKKVGINRFINAQKFLASQIYDNHFKNK